MSALPRPGRTAVDRLVSELRLRDEPARPCWVVHRLHSRALVVPLDGSANGHIFAYGLSRDTVAHAERAGLVALGGGLLPVPPYSGGGPRWSWWDDAKGSTITLALGEGGEPRG